MKFRDNYNMKIENMEDLILISYVMIDELYKQYAPQEVTNGLYQTSCFLIYIFTGTRGDFK